MSHKKSSPALACCRVHLPDSLGTSVHIHICVSSQEVYPELHHTSLFPGPFPFTGTHGKISRRKASSET